MEVLKTIVQVDAVREHEIVCMLDDGNEKVQLVYFPMERKINFSNETPLSEKIHNVKFQFEKVIRSAMKGNLQVGQMISCVFIDGFNFLDNTDFYEYIRVDRRNNKLEITTSKTGYISIHKVYADGSFIDEINQSGYGGFTETPDGRQQIFHQSFNKGSSNLVELLAVMEGLRRLSTMKVIQVNTDSRFVIRGLAQWVHFWKHNNWQTAYGRKVKYAKYWQQIDQLCEGKLIEFKWLKGHSGNEKQDFCHQLARESANHSENDCENI